MKKYIIASLILIVPNPILGSLLYLLRISDSSSLKIGLSIVITNNLKLTKGVHIGHFNYINIYKLDLKEGSKIGNFNIFNGPIIAIFENLSSVGKHCKIRRGPKGVTSGLSIFKLGVLTKVTAYHFLDLTKSITIGDYSIIAGIRSQLWTHGYVHESVGKGRFRVDGEINIGNNVYIGSGVLVNPGIKIADAVSVGGNSSISKSLLKDGLYVNQPLRFVSRNNYEIKGKLIKDLNSDLIEDVYIKTV